MYTRCESYLKFNLELTCTSEFVQIAQGALESAISAFSKTHQCKLIPNQMRKTAWLLINDINMKKTVGKRGRKICLEAIIPHLRKLFSKSLHKMMVLR